VLVLGCGGPTVRNAETPTVKRCLILATNDSESNFDGPKLPSGEYLYPIARVAGVKARELQKNLGGVLLVEAGDLLQGRYMERQDGDAQEARLLALKLYGSVYDQLTLGNHEFDAGTPVLERVLGRWLAMVPGNRLVASNLPMYHELRYARRNCGGVNLGLLGLLTPATTTISDAAGVEIERPAEALRRELPKTQEGNATVLLSHLGFDDDVQLAKDVTGIDVIVGGHSHTVLREPLRVGKTWIGQTGSRFANLAFWELTQVGDGPVQVKYHLEPIDERMPLDLEVKTAVDELRKTLVPEVVIGERKTAWDVLDVAHSEYPRKATRAVLEFAEKETKRKLDGALLNIGGFRSATVYPPGPVTNVEVQAIHPFKNRLVVVTLTGAQLQDTLENACTTGHSEQHGRNLVTWGVQFTCDASKPMIEYAMQDNRPIAIKTRGLRATATVGGKPLDEKATYSIATLDYLGKGGSGYFALTQGDRKCLDGKPFATKVPCPTSPLLSEIITGAVRAGSLDRPL
jgi:2',3'-cyclic-nucleotide 2'-phosphodiesterase (5'-nucleotidase family)